MLNWKKPKLKSCIGISAKITADGPIFGGDSYHIYFLDGMFNLDYSHRGIEGLGFFSCQQEAKDAALEHLLRTYKFAMPR